MHTDRARTAPGYVMANPDDGVTLTDAEGRTLTVTATGGDRIDVRCPDTLRLDPGTVRAFATAMLGFADYTENHPSPPPFHGPEDSSADDDVCAFEDCDERLDDGEGYGGYCGHHADLSESHREGNRLTLAVDEFIAIEGSLAALVVLADRIRRAVYEGQAVDPDDAPAH